MKGNNICAISDNKKGSKKRSTGNLYAAFEEAGDGNGCKTTALLLDPTRTILPNTLYTLKHGL